ncbi:condensation domain-containing protein [Streptomyces sp. NPDC059783]|uniref:condensation domain-containing protein n=1 Tax=Streptomyces sp. NPDC059783 TaxID=3346944 RepID=UPI00364D0ADB
MTAPVLPATTVPLTDLQTQLWIGEQADPGQPDYHELTALVLDGTLAPDRLQHALRTVAARHPSLLTAVVPDGDGAVGHVAPNADGLHVETLPPPRDTTDTGLARLAAAFAERPYRLDTPPLLRAALAPLPDGRTLLLLGMHHLVADGRTADLLLTALDTELRTPGAPGDTPDEGAHAYAAWHANHRSTDAYRESLQHWTRALAGAVPTTPGHPAHDGTRRPEDTAHPGETLHLQLPRPAAHALHRLAADAHVRPFTVLFAASAAVLSVWTGRTDLLLGTAADTRTRRFRDTWGHFANLLPVRLGLAPDTGFARLAEETGERLLDTVEHRQVPFEAVVGAAAPAERGRPRPLVRTVVAEATLTGPDHLAGLPARRLPVPRGRNRFDLMLQADLAPGRETLIVEYDTGLLTRPDVLRLTADCARLLEAAADAPRTPLARLARDTGIQPRTTPRPGTPPAGDAPSRTPGEDTPDDPRTHALARTIAGVWTSHLELARPAGPDDDFFAVGGTSLTAVGVRRRLEAELSLTVPLRRLFDCTTPRALAARLLADTPPTGTAAAPPAPVPVPDRSDGLPLTHAQQDIWMYDRFHPGSTRFTIPLAVDLTGPVDAARLADAASATLAAHPALRSVFPLGPQGPVQREQTAAGPVPVPVLTPADPDEQRDAERDAAARPFDLERQPPVRAMVFDRKADGATLVLVLHHIAADMRAVGVLLQETADRYRGRTGTRLDENRAALARAVDADRAPAPAPAREAWARLLRDHEPLPLPADRAEDGPDTARALTRGLDLPPADADRVRRLMTTHRTSAFMVGAALLADALGELCGTERPVLATLTDNRPPGTDSVVTCLVNTVPLAIDLRGAPGLGELLARTRDAVLDAYEGQTVPTTEILSLTGPGHPRDAWLRIVVDARDEQALAPHLPGHPLRTRFLDAPAALRKDLELSVVRTREGGLRWDIDHRTDALSAAAADRLLDAMLARLRTGTEGDHR